MLQRSVRLCALLRLPLPLRLPLYLAIAIGAPLTPDSTYSPRRARGASGPSDRSGLGGSNGETHSGSESGSGSEYGSEEDSAPIVLTRPKILEVEEERRPQSALGGDGGSASYTSYSKQQQRPSYLSAADDEDDNEGHSGSDDGDSDSDSADSMTGAAFDFRRSMAPLQRRGGRGGGGVGSGSGEPLQGSGGRRTSATATATATASGASASGASATATATATATAASGYAFRGVTRGGTSFLPMGVSSDDGGSSVGAVDSAPLMRRMPSDAANAAASALLGFPSASAEVVDATCASARGPQAHSPLALSDGALEHLDPDLDLDLGLPLHSNGAAAALLLREEHDARNRSRSGSGASSSKRRHRSREAEDAQRPGQHHHHHSHHHHSSHHPHHQLHHHHHHAHSSHHPPTAAQQQKRAKRRDTLLASNSNSAALRASSASPARGSPSQLHMHLQHALLGGLGPGAGPSHATALKRKKQQAQHEGQRAARGGNRAGARGGGGEGEGEEEEREGISTSPGGSSHVINGGGGLRHSGIEWSGKTLHAVELEMERLGRAEWMSQAPDAAYLASRLEAVRRNLEAEEREAEEQQALREMVRKVGGQMPRSSAASQRARSRKRWLSWSDDEEGEEDQDEAEEHEADPAPKQAVVADMQVDPPAAAEAVPPVEVQAAPIKSSVDAPPARGLTQLLPMAPQTFSPRPLQPTPMASIPEDAEMSNLDPPVTQQAPSPAHVPMRPGSAQSSAESSPLASTPSDLQDISPPLVLRPPSMLNTEASRAPPPTTVEMPIDQQLISLAKANAAAQSRARKLAAPASHEAVAPLPARIDPESQLHALEQRVDIRDLKRADLEQVRDLHCLHGDERLLGMEDDDTSVSAHMIRIFLLKT